jgi:uncharacterized protein (DUF305 family)
MFRCVRVSLLSAVVPAALVAQHAHAATATSSDTARGPVAADVAFMQGMIGHHAQALVMTDLLRTRTSTARMHSLAERISVSQRDEILAMRQWLTARRLPLPDSSAHAHHDMRHAAMPGMLTAAQLDTLAAARGPRFDRLFLRYMIQHHEGALTMVATLFGTDGAAMDSQLNSFATDVEADQRAEIARMRSELDRLSAPRSRAARR